MEANLKNQTNLVKRGSVYYFRVRIPQDLTEHYGKTEVIQSLRTKIKQEAEQRVRIERLKWDQEFQQRRALNNATTIDSLSDIEIERLANLFYAEELQVDDERRCKGLSPDQWEQADINYQIDDEILTEGIILGNAKSIEYAVDACIEWYSIKIAKDSNTYKRLAYAFLKAAKQANDSIQARHGGRLINTPTIDPEVIRQITTHETLNTLLTYWKKHGEKAPKTLLEAEATVRKFSLSIGAIPASKITKKHIISFKDSLLEEGKKPATIQKQINLLRAIFELAVSNELIPTNPAHKVQAPKERNKQKSRVGFSTDDLNKIFSMDVFTAGARPMGGKGEAAFWIPLIALFTGARLEEIGQLLIGDIKEVKGIHFFHITDEGEGRKKLKTASSRRRVPIHPTLINHGLLVYIEQLKAKSNTRLFPLLFAAEGRQLTAAFSQWFSRFLRQSAGITDTRKVFHSFRHGFKDACRENSIGREINDNLTGHAKLNEGDKYGGDNYPLKPLAEAMMKLEYPGLNLTGLHLNDYST